MSIRLFDIQAGFGGASPGYATVLEAAEVVDDLRRLDIAGALVRITPETLDTDVPGSNALLYAACAAHPELVPCPVVVPNGGDGIPAPAEAVDDAVRCGAGAVVVRPGPDFHNWGQRNNYPTWGIVPTSDEEWSMYISEHYCQPDVPTRFRQPE